MTLSRHSPSFGNCIICKAPLFMKETVEWHQGWNEPHPESRVIRHYRKKHPEIFDKLLRRNG